MKSKMTVEQLRASGRIIFECVSGSHLYNLNIPTSDRDIRGVYLNPQSEYLGLNEPEPQVSDDKHDTVYYSLKRYFELLKTANPNIIELAFVPQSNSTIWTSVWQKMCDNRNSFITKKAYDSHSAYAIAQIKKAKGSNKKVHNPMSEEMPRKEDFCWYISVGDEDNEYDGSELWFNNIRKFARLFRKKREENFPFRPKPLRHTSINLAEYHATSLEHTPNVFRLYYYGKEAKGVFRGDQYLTCESIPKEDENEKFRGILIYNHPEFERAVKDWHSYWDWMKNRNEARWIDQEKGLLNYDQKNMCHCVRLILSCENILRHGFPLVRFDGELREYLMKIRSGELAYEKIMEDVESKKIILESLLKKSNLPEEINIDVLDSLYRNISG